MYQGPHGGIRPFYQKSTCPTQLSFGPYAGVEARNLLDEDADEERDERREAQEDERRVLQRPPPARTGVNNVPSRISGSYTFVSLNSRLESDKDEENICSPVVGHTWFNTRMVQREEEGNERRETQEDERRVLQRPPPVGMWAQCRFTNSRSVALQTVAVSLYKQSHDCLLYKQSNGREAQEDERRVIQRPPT